MNRRGPDAAAPDSRDSSRVCFATATTESFVPGALTAVGSFLQQHPCFEGDVVVVHDGLPRESQAYLEALSDRVRLEPVSAALLERLAGLKSESNFTPHHVGQLYALEAFRLTGYRRVLFCDADLLFRRPIGEVFAADAELLCCGDGPTVRGRRRDTLTYAETDAADGLGRTFNSGFMLIDARLISDRQYAEVLELVSPETWRRTDGRHADQLVLNRYFAGHQTLAGSTYNYLLAHARDIRRRENLPWDEANALHFNLPTKPWQLLGAPPGRIRPRLLPAYKLWFMAWLDAVALAGQQLQ